ncbi:uncharacterized protein [Drosophila pseudoobscura]|uniref:Uncharacterized protein isoform X16 n=1 Tax=Drosophila pseudoobscura pseudoobscura TaxID=46245 RepID=A0A6I8VFJ9_DROPS|nr:uncharacterized protein LOC4804872 isoform X16 [Drosophila pseudoobscura]
MYTEFWFCGILFSIVFWLVGRECYLFVKLKVEEWNIQVYERILREEMMLRLSIEAVLQEQGEPEFDAGEQRCSKLGGRRSPGGCAEHFGGSAAQPVWRYILHRAKQRGVGPHSQPAGEGRQGAAQL